MAELNVARLIETCDKIERATVYAGKEYAHGSVRLFDACMRTMDTKPAANFVTFRVYWGAPFMRPGTVSIHRDGTVAMTTGLE